MAKSELEARWPEWPDGEEGRVLLDVVLDLQVDKAFLLLFGGLTELTVSWEQQPTRAASFWRRPPTRGSHGWWPPGGGAVLHPEVAGGPLATLQ
jgi:hypothetical protein